MKRGGGIEFLPTILEGGHIPFGPNLGLGRPGTDQLGAPIPKMRTSDFSIFRFVTVNISTDHYATKYVSGWHFRLEGGSSSVSFILNWGEAMEARGV